MEASDKAAPKDKKQGQEEERPKIEFPHLDAVTEPNEAEMQAFEQKIHQDYAALQNRMREVHRLIREKELEKQRALQDQNRMFSALQTLDAECQKKMKEREPVEMAHDNLDRAAKREQDELTQMRQRCEFLEEKALDDALAEKQHYLESNSLSAADERKLVKEISRLRSSRPIIKEYREKKVLVQNAIEALRKCEASFRDKNRELERLNERVVRQKQLWESTKGKESSLDKEINRLRSEDVAKITTEMQEMSTSLNRKREEFRRQKELYEAYKAELARRQRILDEDKALRQADARRKAMADRRAEQERLWKERQEEFEIVPWCEEMALCDTLVHYLERILQQAGLPVPAQSPAAASAPAEGAAAASSPAESTPASEKKAVPEEVLGEDGQTLVVKKEDDGFFFKGKGKKNKKEKAAKASETLTHAADIFTGFSSLELQPPLLLSDVAAAIETLKAKKENFKSLPPPPPDQKRGPRRERPEGDRRTRPATAQEKPHRPAASTPFRASDVDWASLPPAAAKAEAAPAEGAAPAATPAAAASASAPKPTVWSKFAGARPFRASAEQPPLPPPKVAAH